jgi:hypothetical protein
MTHLVITRAKVAPDYRDTAISKLKQVKKVSESNGAKLVRIAAQTSGSHVGSLIMLQFFENMADVERVYDAFNEMPIYAETMQSGKFDLTHRALLKIHLELGETSSSDNLKYLVLTNGTAETPELDAITKFANVLLSNGAVTARYGSFVVGDQADGKTHLFGATYPSLSAMQTAYEAVTQNDAASALYKAVSVQRRQVLRLLD